MNKKFSTEIISLLVACFIVSAFCIPAPAAQFSANIVTTGAPDNFEYKLYVKDNVYRLKKIRGDTRGIQMPPYPLIVNRETGVTTMLNPQVRQYMETSDRDKTFMANPIVAWNIARNNMDKKKGPEEFLKGYDCTTFSYNVPGESRTAYKVWYSSKLGFFVKQAAYADNGTITMELQNIQEGPADEALFHIPPGYTKFEEPSGTTATSKVRQASNQKTTSRKDTVNVESAHPSVKGNTQTGNNIFFILDASGSMWGRVQGKSKIAIAKDVLTGLIKELPDDTTVGLVAYGHRRKGDCDDVEELMPLGPIDKDKLIGTVQGLNPKGKTPISRSVRLTANRIKHLEEETTIILVSDGKETCDPDPCRLVRELKEAGIRFVMHVIGFDVTEEERSELECMANSGDGEYFTAKTARDFQLAATKVVKKATEKPPVSLTVTSVKKGKPFKTYVQVLARKGGKRVGEDWTSAEKPAVFRLPPGIYDVRAQDQGIIEKPIVYIKDVEIIEGETTERIANFATEGVLHVKAVKKNAPFKAYIKVHRQEDNKYMRDGWTRGNGTPAEFKLLPGLYKIRVQDQSLTQRPVIWIENVEVKPGEIMERVATFGVGGILHVKAVKKNAPAKTYVKVFQQKDDKYMRDGWTRENGTPAEFKLLPGLYKIRVQDQSLTQRPVTWIENVEVKPGEIMERVATFGVGGTLHVKAVKKNAPAKTYVKVFQQKDDKYIRDGWTRENGTPAEFKLLPGLYKIRVQDQSVKQRPIVFIENVEVKSDQTVERFATFMAGGILKVTATKNGAPFKAYIKIYNQQNNKYMGDGWTRGNGTSVKYKLLPGVYYAKVEDKQERAVREIRDVQVESEKTVTVNGSFPIKAETPVTVPVAKTQAPSAPATTALGTPSFGQEKTAAGSDAIMKGEVPLMKGAKVLKSLNYGLNSQVDLTVPGSPEEIVAFYKKTMADRGWQAGIAIVQQNKGVLQLKNGGKQLILKAQGQGQNSKVSMTLMGQ